jgi:zinc finger protein
MFVKSFHSVVSVPEIGFEIPPRTQQDSFSTVEGVLTRAFEGLSELNKPELFEFLEKLDQCRKGQIEFEFIVDDPSGNSFIENSISPEKDPNLQVTFYKRTAEQTEIIGLMNIPIGDNIELENEKEFKSSFATEAEVQNIPCGCPVCSTEGFN